MDLDKLGYNYEFLDLTDIDEQEKQHLKQTLFAEGTLDFLQLPWSNPTTCEEWHKDTTTYGSEVIPLTNGPQNPPGTSQDVLVDHTTPNAPVAPAPLPPQPVTVYSTPVLPAYTMPTPTYQHPFATNVSTSMQPVMPTHYVQPHFPMQQEELSGRGHRGRGRVRSGKRGDVRMDSMEGTSPQFPPHFMHGPTVYYTTGYYTQPMGSAMQHPNPTAASPVYVPLYPNLYGPYHPPGPQYYPPQTAHVNTVMEDSPPPGCIQTELPISHNQDEYQPVNDYSSQPILSSVHIDTSDVNKQTNNNFLNTNNNHVKTDTHKTVPPKQKPFSPPSSKSANELKNNQVQISATNTNSSSPEPQVIPSKTRSPTPELEPKPIEIKLEPESPPKIEPVDIPHPIITSPVSIAMSVACTVSGSSSMISSSFTPQVPTVVSAPASKSWASLFSNKSSSVVNNLISDVSKSPKIEVETTKFENDKQQKTDKTEQKPVQKRSAYTNDPVSHRMGEILVKYALDNRTVSLQPRGLTNRSNYCYINSILQALLACPPFYNLLTALPHRNRKNSTGKSPTPIIDSMIEFVNEFIPLSAGARLNRKEKNARKDENSDVPCGPAFEPSWIYKILNGIRSDTFIVEGRQEDAEEFFGCLLNGLNDEMLELMKLAESNTQNNNINNNNNIAKSLSNGDIVSNGDSNDQDDEEWKVMGPKNKGSVTRRAEFGRSPISDIFRGQLCSRVHRTNSRAQDQVTDNVQPFFTLQLDIEKANSVTEALEVLVHKDKLEGVTCSKTNQQVEAWQQVTVEELPLVMVLHLKCFNYKLDVCSKIIKTVEFPIDLKIDSKLLSAKAKYTGKQKQYKLFAVVYHDGKEATKGHYLTDAFHVGYGGWMRYDDSTVKSVTEQLVLHPSAARVPYLLFYRRCDTIGNQNANNNNNNNNKKD